MGDLHDIYGDSDFDTGSVEPSKGSDFELLPPNWYNVELSDAKVKNTKAGNGKYLEVTLTVLDGEHKSRRLWARFNLKNANHQAEEIGARELAGLGIACGLTVISDSAELNGRAVMAKVKIKAKEGQEPENAVVAYKACGEETAAPAAARPAAAPAARPAAAAPAKPAPAAAATATKPAPAKRPWER
jgi:hypothetical protein